MSVYPVKTSTDRPSPVRRLHPLNQPVTLRIQPTQRVDALQQLLDLAQFRCRLGRVLWQTGCQLDAQQVFQLLGIFDIRHGVLVSVLRNHGL